MSERELTIQAAKEIAECAGGAAMILFTIGFYKYNQLKGKRLLEKPIAIFTTETTPEQMESRLISEYETQVSTLQDFGQSGEGVRVGIWQDGKLYSYSVESGFTIETSEQTKARQSNSSTWQNNR